MSIISTNYFWQHYQNLKDKNIEVEGGDINEFNHYYNEIEALINRFDIIDKGSFSLRYPVDKKNNLVFKYDDKVNILDIKDVFDKAMILLYYTSSVFSKYTDYLSMIEDAYNEEMRIAYGNF